MKLSDYVALFLKTKVDTVFCVTGGCIVHLIDSVAKVNLHYLPMQHEQNCAFAADAYSRIHGFGAVLTTSGPGATNLLTGVCSSFYDSVPVLYITGQVPSNHLKKGGERQIGFQETDVLSIFRSVTKYVAQIRNPAFIRYELEKAFYIANEGRKGPVLLDICDDVQRAEIDPEKLVPHRPHSNPALPLDIEPVIRMIEESERPLFIFGAGAKEAELEKLILKYHIPFTLTWGAIERFETDHPLFAGTFGVSSTRSGNFAVQNADLLVCLGTRLDTHETGSNYKDFAPRAKKIIVDIDKEEQAKYERRGLDAVLITADAKLVVEEMLKHDPKPSSRQWIERIQNWRMKYPVVTEEDRKQDVCINPYVFMETLGRVADQDAIIVADSGSTNGWAAQAFNIKHHKIIHAWNHSPMGYGLPAGIGAAMASKKQIIVIAGDGGFQMSLPELATLVRHQINLKIFVMNNHGYGMIKGTQDSWLDKRYNASSVACGLPDIDFMNIARAYGLAVCNLDVDLKADLKAIFETPGPVLVNVNMKSKMQIAPKLLYGSRFEDLSPKLPEEELKENMC